MIDVESSAQVQDGSNPNPKCKVKTESGHVRASCSFLMVFSPRPAQGGGHIGAIAPWSHWIYWGHWPSRRLFEPLPFSSRWNHCPTQRLRAISSSTFRSTSISPPRWPRPPLLLSFPRQSWIRDIPRKPHGLVSLSTPQSLLAWPPACLASRVTVTSSVFAGLVAIDSGSQHLPEGDAPYARIQTQPPRLWIGVLPRHAS